MHVHLVAWVVCGCRNSRSHFSSLFDVTLRLPISF